MAQMQRHKELINEQDEQLDEIHDIAKNLNYHAQDIESELKLQDKKIKKMSIEMDKAYDKLSAVDKKLSKIMKTNDPTTLHTILCLSGIILVLILLVVIL